MNEAQERERQIDKALRSLTAAPVPEDMQARLQNNLRTLQNERVLQAERKLRNAAATRHESSPRAVRLAWAAVALSLLAVSFYLMHEGAKRDAGVVAPGTLLATEQPAKAATDSSAPEALLSRRPALVKQLIPPKPKTSMRKATAPSQLMQAPPLPLTSQERMLLALARTPGSAEDVTVSASADDHGLGENALFELDHETLPAQPASSLETDSLPASPPSSTVPSSNLPGENQ